MAFTITDDPFVGNTVELKQQYQNQVQLISRFETLKKASFNAVAFAGVLAALSLIASLIEPQLKGVSVFLAGSVLLLGALWLFSVWKVTSLQLKKGKAYLELFMANLMVYLAPAFWHNYQEGWSTFDRSPQAPNQGQILDGIEPYFDEAYHLVTNWVVVGFDEKPISYGIAKDRAKGILGVWSGELTLDGLPSEMRPKGLLPSQWGSNEEPSASTS